MRDTMFVELDVQKASILVAVAASERGGEVRSWGSVANRADRIATLVAKLEAGGRHPFLP